MAKLIPRIIKYIIGLFTVMLGIALYVPANIVPLPTEGLIKAVSEVSERNFSDIKVIFDCAVVVISAVLCLIFLHSFGSIGFGTVIMAFLVGIINKKIIIFFKNVKIIK